MSAKSERNSKAELNNSLTSSQETNQQPNITGHRSYILAEKLLHKLSQSIAGSAQPDTKMMEFR